MSIKQEIELVKYNAKWPKLFSVEANNIKQILDTYCLSIHHIGSTSIPGTISKNTIDILCVVDKLKPSLKLASHGYIYKGELNIPMRYYFSKNTTAPRINLHVCEKDNGFIKLNLTFRNYLRNNDQYRDAYNDLKKRLLKDPSSQIKQQNRFSGYNLGKNQFIKDILVKSKFDEICVNFCMHDKEWDTYKEIIFEHYKNIDFINFNNVNYRHFILYKGEKIKSAACIEIVRDQVAKLLFVITNKNNRIKSYNQSLLIFINQWAHNHDLTLQID